jgi:hypothetical protein
MKTGRIDLAFSKHLKKSLDALELVVGGKENWPTLRRLMLTSVNELHRHVIELVNEGTQLEWNIDKEGKGNGNKQSPSHRK